MAFVLCLTTYVCKVRDNKGPVLLKNTLVVSLGMLGVHNTHTHRDRVTNTHSGLHTHTNTQGFTHTHTHTQTHTQTHTHTHRDTNTHTQGN